MRFYTEQTVKLSNPILQRFMRGSTSCRSSYLRFYIFMWSFTTRGLRVEVLSCRKYCNVFLGIILQGPAPEWLYHLLFSGGVQYCQYWPSVLNLKVNMTSWRKQISNSQKNTFENYGLSPMMNQFAELKNLPQKNAQKNILGGHSEKYPGRSLGIRTHTVILSFLW